MKTMCLDRLCLVRPASFPSAEASARAYFNAHEAKANTLGKPLFLLAKRIFPYFDFPPEDAVLLLVEFLTDGRLRVSYDHF